MIAGARFGLEKPKWSQNLAAIAFVAAIPALIVAALAAGIATGSDAPYAMLKIAGVVFGAVFAVLASLCLLVAAISAGLAHLGIAPSPVMASLLGAMLGTLLLLPLLPLGGAAMFGAIPGGLAALFWSGIRSPAPSKGRSDG